MSSGKRRERKWIRLASTDKNQHPASGNVNGMSKKTSKKIYNFVLTHCNVVYIGLVCLLFFIVHVLEPNNVDHNSIYRVLIFCACSHLIPESILRSYENGINVNFITRKVKMARDLDFKKMMLFFLTGRCF